jgi:hypothetical protein
MGLVFFFFVLSLHAGTRLSVTVLSFSQKQRKKKGAFVVVFTKTKKKKGRSFDQIDQAIGQNSKGKWFSSSSNLSFFLFTNLLD